MKDLLSLGLKVTDNKLQLLDQQSLPQKEDWFESPNIDSMVNAIKKLKIRGAPMIGISAAIQLALYAKDGASEKEILIAAEKLRNTRPTAVNLMNALDTLIHSPDGLKSENLEFLAEKLFEDDIELCNRISEHGNQLVNKNDNILTHCNTGSLATAGTGTALGIIKKSHQENKNIHVYVDETRPLLQGGRLTTWELNKFEIPNTLICDNMSAQVMKEKRVDKIFVGADRITRNGDTANKIGTYALAILANYHKIPFYIVAPSTTLDLNLNSGEKIKIEQRDPDEVRGFIQPQKSITWSPEKTQTYNPAFDVTPINLITGIILETGYYSKENIKDGALKNLN